LTDSVALKIAVADYPHTVALKDGSVPIRGVQPEFVNVVPQIAAFRRMVRDLEFDVCELAPTTYLIARAFGAPFVALPIFVMRRFHHGGLVVRPDADIRHPKDLEGKRVGVRAYSVTTGAWTRGILIADYGLDSSRVTWVVDDEEHVTQLRLPANVVHAPAGQSLASLIDAGELQAAFDGNAGIGRAGPPTAGWTASSGSASRYQELFPDAEPLEAEWFARTGIYPMHGTIVVKEDVLARHPWVARSLFDAFNAAKNQWLADLDDNDTTADGRKYQRLRKIVGADPLPNGIKANLPTINALQDYACAQELIPKRMPVETLFCDPETL
jgi:4,5-dihydroxyphthalate decarboxylase